MSHFENRYELVEARSAHDLKFFFISKGEQDIIKTIQYSFVQKLLGTQVYNLGFGDYDLENDYVIDHVNSNNGDPYKVFNTILSTIPVFFQHFESCIIMVQGSDGRPEYVEQCKQTCRKNCADECRNFNRRINIYRNYVNKHFDQLSADYQFLGGIKQLEQHITIEYYVPYKNYDSIFLFRKTHNFAL